MKLTDELKIIDDKTKVNQAQYNLSREAAKISALSSKNLANLEYLTGDDLGHKPNELEKAKLEYSPLGMILDKAFKKMRLKILLTRKVILLMIANMPFTDFTKGFMDLKRCH